MSGSLLPWWGWLLILQAIFVYGLFEYVRRQAVSPMTVPSLGEVNAVLEHRADRLSSRFTQSVNELLIGHTKREDGIEALAKRTHAEVAKLQPRVEELHRLVRAVIDDYQRMSGLEARFEEGQSRLQTALAPIIALPQMAESLRSDLIVVQRDLEKMEEVQRGERDRRLGSLYALGARERLANLQDQIEHDASSLYDGLKSGETYDQSRWEQWETTHSRWQTSLNEWLDTATWYALAVKERTLTVDENKYGLDWSVLENQFPNAEAVRRFRKFRIIHQQWEQVIPNVIGGLNGVAFNGLTDLEARSGRPAG